MRPCIVVFTLFLLPVGLSAQTIVRGPYLQVLTDHSIEICWSTDVATDSRVLFGTELHAQLSAATDLMAKTDHFITLSDLAPSTTYYYSVGNTTQVIEGGLEAFRFKTAPLPGTVGKYRMWGIGDFGKGNQGQLDVMNSFLAYPDTAHTDFLFMLGDNVYDDGTQLEYREKMFDVYDSIFTYLPVFSTPGNHDYGSINRFDPPLQHRGPYFDIFDSPILGEAGGVPSNTELYYSFDFGNIHFISLNSELQSWILTANSPMFQWLEQDLSANTRDWTVCIFHQPPYSKGSHNSDDFWEVFMRAMRQNALPILEKHGVDLVICGHSHVYERSKLIKGHYGASSSFNNNTHAVSTASGVYAQGAHYTKYRYGSNAGTVYIVCGNSGSKTDNPSLNHPAMVSNHGGSTAYGSFLLEVEGNRLDGKYLTSTGVLYDHFTIIKPDVLTPVSVEESGSKDMAGVTFFPNPTRKSFNLSFSLRKEQAITLSIHRTDGREVYREQLSGVVGENHFTRSVGFLKSGQYYLSLFGEGKPVAVSFLKR
jgi:Icc-related predicted phosphoesterase